MYSNFSSCILYLITFLMRAQSSSKHPLFKRYCIFKFAWCHRRKQYLAGVFSERFERQKKRLKRQILCLGPNKSISKSIMHFDDFIFVVLFFVFFLYCDFGTAVWKHFIAFPIKFWWICLHEAKNESYTVMLPCQAPKIQTGQNAMVWKFSLAFNDQWLSDVAKVLSCSQARALH